MFPHNPCPMLAIRIKTADDSVLLSPLPNHSPSAREYTLSLQADCDVDGV